MSGRVRTNLALASARLARLRQSILPKAFTGQRV